MNRSGAHPTVKMKDAFSWLADPEGNHGDVAPSSHWSRFAILLLMHVATIQVSQASDTAMSWRGNSDSWTAAADNPGVTFEHLQATLNKCRSLVVASGTLRSDIWMERGDSLLFNAVSILRLCYGRVLPLAAYRSSLLRCEDERLEALLRAFVREEQVRNNFITQTVSWIFDGLCVPVRKGILLVRKTAALTWSMEHAIAGWDTGLCITPRYLPVEQSC